mgnify:CR=1 FL=1
MTKWIIGAVLCGIAAGYFLIPDAIAAHCGTFITVGLCLILFLVGMDMGRQGGVWEDIKAAGLKVLLIPVAVAAGTIGFAALGSLLLPLSARETMAASAGLGWYSLAPMLLSSYSASLSAVAFLSNVMREVLSILLIPVVAKRLGYIECVALPGAAAMDTVLPVVVSATHERITIYSFVSGVVLSFAVPVLVPLIMNW